MTLHSRAAVAGVTIRHGKEPGGGYFWELLPVGWRGDGGFPGVVYCGGFGAGAWNIRGAQDRFQYPKAGYPMFSRDLGDTPTTPGGSNGPGVWGNDPSQAALTALIADMEASRGCRVGRHLLIGGSHGASVALRYAFDHPTKVLGVACYIGTVDVEDIRANNRQGYKASIDAAHGLNGTTPVPASKNPAQLAATWPTTVPVRLWYSDDDPICLASTQTAFAAAAAAAGADVVATSFGARSHSLVAFPWSDLTAWAGSRLEGT